MAYCDDRQSRYSTHGWRNRQHGRGERASEHAKRRYYANSLTMKTASRPAITCGNSIAIPLRCRTRLAVFSEVPPTQRADHTAARPALLDMAFISQRRGLKGVRANASTLPAQPKAMQEDVSGTSCRLRQ